MINEDDIFCQIEIQQEAIAYYKEMIQEIIREGGTLEELTRIRQQIHKAERRIAELEALF